MNRKCIYFVEGLCEEQLIKALKEPPAKILYGKVKVFNVIQNIIPKSLLLSIQPGTIFTLAFDTDVKKTDTLIKNIERLTHFCGSIRIVYLPQVLTLEDELVRCTNIKSIPDLTKSNSIKNFKTDFCKITPKDCRFLLERHHPNHERLWTTEPFDIFSFIIPNSPLIKV